MFQWGSEVGVSCKGGITGKGNWHWRTLEMLLGNLLLKRFPRIYTSRNGVLVALLYNLGTMAPPDIIGYKKLRARYGLSLLVCDQSSPIVTPPPNITIYYQCVWSPIPARTWKKKLTGEGTAYLGHWAWRNQGGTNLVRSSLLLPFIVLESSSHVYWGRKAFSILTQLWILWMIITTCVTRNAHQCNWCTNVSDSI